MKNRNWLNVAEYLLLVGSGVGSVATAVSQQFLYTAAPLSVLMMVNLANHRRLEKSAEDLTEDAVAQLDRKLSGTIRLLQQQMQTLPSPLHLASLRQDLQAKNQQAFSELAKAITQVRRELADPNWRSLPQDVAHLQTQYSTMVASIVDAREALNRLETARPPETLLHPDMDDLKAELARLQESIQTLSSEHRFNQYRALQEQITQINRRLNNLPAPFDASALKQDVDSLIKVVGDLASRRDVARVEAQLDLLSKRNSDLDHAIAPLRLATSILKKQVDTVAAKVTQLEIEGPQSHPVAIAPEVIPALQTAINALEQRLEQMPATADLSALRTQVEHLVSEQVGQVQTQLDTVHYQTQELDRDQKSLRNWVNHLPQLLDTSALHNEVKYLASRMEWAENTVSDLQSQSSTRHQAPPYEWVFDLQTGVASAGNPAIAPAAAEREPPPPFRFHNSRSLLEQALDTAQARLIVVYPIATAETLDETMMHQFRQFLARNGCLDIGLGRLEQDDFGANLNLQHRIDLPVRLPRSLDSQPSSSGDQQVFLHDLLHQLTTLKKQYPDQVRFKVLGTAESFLVCDRAYAVLATPAIATASTIFPQAATGLRTTEPEVIQRLVDRFDHPVLAADDAVAHFNRAGSRYILGDRQGAIADYTEVLTLHPDDDVAFNNRGLARYAIGDREGAIADLSEALHHNPDNYIAYCNRGFVRSESGDKLGAIEDYTYAIQLNPDYAIAYFYRGLARTRMQNRLGAVQDYTEVIRLNSQDAIAHFYRGLACAKLGHRIEAMHDLRQAAQLFKAQGSHTNYQQTLTAIKKLQKMLVMNQSEKVLAPAVEPVKG